MGRLEYVGIPTVDTARLLADRHSFHPALCCDASLTGPSLVCSRAPVSFRIRAVAHVYVPADIIDRPTDSEEVQGSLPLLSRFLCHGGVCALPAALEQSEGGTYVPLPGAEGKLSLPGNA